MADGTFNIAKGKVNEYVDRVDGNDPTDAVLVLVILEANEADGTLEDYDTLAALLAGSNTESAATNYARAILADTDISPSAVDDTNNRRESAIPDETFTGLGPGNATTKIVVCYDPDSTGGTDANIIPLTHHDWVGTPNGGDVTVSFTTGTDLFFRAA